MPGQLGQPVLNIVNARQSARPHGARAILAAIQNGAHVPRHGRLAATIGLAQATGANATSAAADAGKLAAANLAVAAQKEVELAKIAAQVALASMGMPAGSAEHTDDPFGDGGSAQRRRRAREEARGRGDGRPRGRLGRGTSTRDR